MAGDWGDGRFYYSGMAQAMLLDVLLPDWKEQVLVDGVFLEGLLMTAVGDSTAVPIGLHQVELHIKPDGNELAVAH